MELQDIFSIWDRFDASDATRLELELEGVGLKLEKGLPVPASPVQRAAASERGAGPAGAPEAEICQADAPAAEAGRADALPADAVYIRAPLVGAFYTAAGPDKAPLAPVGQRVQKGQSVCILEAMKMLSEVPAPMDCIIREVLLQDGQLADFDAPLFRIEPL